MGLPWGFVTSTEAADISRNDVASRSYGRGRQSCPSLAAKSCWPCFSTVTNSRPPAHLVVFLLKGSLNENHFFCLYCNFYCFLLIFSGKELKKTIAEIKVTLQKALELRDDKLYAIGNLVHDSVPISMDEKDNGV